MKVIFCTRDWIRRTDDFSYCTSQFSCQYPLAGRVIGLGVVLLKSVSVPIVQLMDLIRGIGALIFNALGCLYSDQYRSDFRKVSSDVSQGVYLPYYFVGLVIQCIKGSLGVLINPRAERALRFDSMLSCNLRLEVVQES